jgi:D-alanyl-D-alanine carboxypeptidase
LEKTADEIVKNKTDYHLHEQVFCASITQIMKAYLCSPAAKAGYL